MTPAARPWYKEPMMWLVVGAPAIVVVAAIYTVVVAYTHADAVLDKSPPVQIDEKMLEGLSPEQRKAVLFGMEPAGQARNHAASPKLSEDK